MIKIRKLPASKWNEYRNLRLDALKKDPIAFGSSYNEEKSLPEKEWKKRIKNVLFAFSDDKLIGMIVYVFNNREKIKHIANIYGFYMKKEFRNKGVGKKLVENVLLIIKKDKNIIKIVLWVNARQKAAIRLYGKFGFRHVGRLKKDLLINGKFYDELIMERFV